MSQNTIQTIQKSFGWLLEEDSNICKNNQNIDFSHQLRNIMPRPRTRRSRRQTPSPTRTEESNTQTLIEEIRKVRSEISSIQGTHASMKEIHSSIKEMLGLQQDGGDNPLQENRITLACLLTTTQPL